MTGFYMMATLTFSDLTLLIVPTCQAFYCTKISGKTEKGNSFFRIPETKNPTERKKAQQWLHNMGMGLDIKTLKFVKDSVLCENHFHWRPAT